MILIELSSLCDIYNVYQIYIIFKVNHERITSKYKNTLK